ncbi:MAG TPA: FecR domain-containing protein [Methylomirabilota bacterium]|nr:FecR domain-containing protein [Methylomirabilota bacterium]
MTLTRTLAVLALAAVLPPAAAGAQPAASRGVVTTLAGRASVARPGESDALALQFRDPLYTRDRITTAQRSLVRMLLGGNALVTVRELSVLTLTAETDDTAVNVQSGKLSLSVVRPAGGGRPVQLRTPNAVVAVRGTSLVAETTPALAATPIVTRLWLLHGLVEVFPPGAPPGARGILLRAGEGLVVTGAAFGQPFPLTAEERERAVADLKPGGPQLTAVPDATRRALVEQVGFEPPGGGLGTPPAGPLPGAPSPPSVPLIPSLTPAPSAGGTRGGGTPGGGGSCGPNC